LDRELFGKMHTPFQRSDTSCCSLTHGSPKTKPAESSTPDKEKLPMGKRKPPKIRTTPEKDKDANQSKKK
jgi:hypothetical protein